MERPEDPTCAVLVELVTEYLEGALPAADARRFAAHLEECEGCAIYVEQLRITLELTGRLRQDDLGEPARDALLGVLRRWLASTE